jgi:hypothetical protein
MDAGRTVVTQRACATRTKRAESGAIINNGHPASSPFNAIFNLHHQGISSMARIKLIAAHAGKDSPRRWYIVASWYMM